MENEAQAKKLRKKRKLAFIGLLGRRGTLEIFFLLRRYGGLRFNNIADKLENLSTKTIVKRLRELEHWHLVTRKIYREIPPRVEYHFTRRGEELAKALKPLASWIDSSAENPE